MALDDLIALCEPSQVRHMMHVIEPQFQRDFISLLPKEVCACGFKIKCEFFFYQGMFCTLLSHVTCYMCALLSRVLFCFNFS
jgi:hypothetical protein